MDREQEELQFLGFFGIFTESFKLIHSCRKIFTHISLALILPLSFIFLAHLEISHLLFSTITRNEDRLDHTPDGSPTHQRLSDLISSEWVTFLLFKAAYFTFFLVLLLLSTAAVVYTVACVYTAKDISFSKVISVVPKVWKRLMITFFTSFAIIFAYNLLAITFFVTATVLLWTKPLLLTVLILLLVAYCIGLLYISIVWHVASVATVLEDVCGVRAMVKSRELVKGKLGLSAAIFLVLNLCAVVVHVMFQKLVVRGKREEIGARIGYGAVCLGLQLVLILFGLVVQTVIYFVCKSHHHENIDKSLLADHLEVYLGEYVPLKSKDVQLEQYYV